MSFIDPEQQSSNPQPSAIPVDDIELAKRALRQVADYGGNETARVEAAKILLYLCGFSIAPYFVGLPTQPQ